jgi:hypothetical protein
MCENESRTREWMEKYLIDGDDVGGERFLVVEK